MNRHQIALFLLLSLTIASTLVNNRLFASQTLISYFLYSFFALIITIYTSSIYLTRNKRFQLNLSISTLVFILWGTYIILNGLQHGWNHRYFYLVISVLFCFSLSQITDQLISARRIYMIITIAAFIEAIVCILQSLGFSGSFNAYFQVTGTQVNPNITAMFLTMAIPTLILTPFQKNITKINLVLWVRLFVGFCIALALVLLKCRTAFLGAAVSAIIILSIRFRLIDKLFDKRSRLLVVALFILTIGLTVPIISSAYHSKQASADGRKTIWKISLQMIAEKPLFGCGYGMFERNYNLHQAKYFEQGNATQQETTNASFVRMAYNEPLENAVEGGVVGLFLFIGVLIVLLVYGGKRCGIVKQPQKLEESKLTYAVAFSGIAAFTVMSLVNFTIQAIPVMCLFIVYAGILTAKLERGTEEAKNSSHLVFKKQRLTNGLTKVIGIILIIMALGLITIQGLNGIAQFQLKQAVKMRRIGNPILAETILRQLDTKLEKSDNYLFERGKVLMTLENYPLALKNLTKATNFTSDPDLYLDMGKCQQALMQPEEAKKAYQLAMFMVPTRFIPRYMLMELYRQKNDTINSLLMGRSILQIKPKVPSQEVDFYKKEARKLVQELGVSHSSSLLRSGKLDSHGVKVFHPFGKGKFKYIKSKVTGETN